MPIYEYACASCGAHVELLQKVGGLPPLQCASCGKPDTMSKKVSKTSFQLKGGGWYSDLYGSVPAKKDEKHDSSEKKENPPKEESKTEPKSESKTESKTESKPEPKSE